MCFVQTLSALNQSFSPLSRPRFLWACPTSGAGGLQDQGRGIDPGRGAVRQRLHASRYGGAALSHFTARRGGLLPQSQTGEFSPSLMDWMLWRKHAEGIFRTQTLLFSFPKNPSGIEILSSPVNKLMSICMYKVEVTAVCTCSHDSVMQAQFSAARTC